MAKGASQSGDLLSGSSVKILLLGLTAVWQVYTMGRLGAYGSHLVESRDRHGELQRSLHDAQGALTGLLNSSRSCESQAAEHAAALDGAARERKALELAHLCRDWERRRACER